MHLGVEYAVRQLARGLIELALKLQNLRTTDATGHRLLPVAGKAGLPQRLIRDLPGLIEPPDQPQRLIRDLPGLIEPPDQPQQGDLFVEGGQAAQIAEFDESLASGQQVDFFAQGDGIVTDDEAQGVFLY
ncbi:hypothetical protein [Cryobacterium sp. N21]|uniref:hypothetical protein n=1 Tax=Cryobacterium sp. N21 TaxID=2048289 RepID=UPI001E2BB16D|nr:hypothetical protein [Cryobacterium sp. N21]